MATGNDIVFMGAPDFAARHLSALIEGGAAVVGVVTQPDRPKGRGRRVAPTPVKSVALERGIPFIQPESLKKEEQSLQWIKDLKPDLLVVVAYGALLPASLLESAAHGGWNVHASLLPLYRGAAPIQWAILKGENKTGVTLMQVDEGMDTGDILLREAIDIGPEETGGQLTERLAELGSRILLKGLDMLAAGRLEPRPQNHDEATYTSRITKEDRYVDWSNSAVDIFNKIKAFNPRPGARAGELKLLKAKPLDDKTAKSPGEALEVTREGIKVATGKGTLLLMELQPPGKRPMAAADYASGHNVKVGAILN